MINVEISKADMKKLTDKLNALSPKKSQQAYKGMVATVGQRMRNELIKTVSGPVLKVRSGALRRSIQYAVKLKGDELACIVGSGVGQGGRVKYANIHETGGTIKPKNGKYLAIPTKHAKTKAGAKRTGPRDYADTFVHNKTIFQRQGKKVVPLFTLVTSVRIPARRWMSKTAAIVRPLVAKIAMEHIERILKRKA